MPKLHIILDITKAERSRLKIIAELRGVSLQTLVAEALRKIIAQSNQALSGIEKDSAE